MLKITNGKETLLVTASAFKTQFKPFGWERIEVGQREVEAVSVNVEGDDEAPDVDTLKIEKPLSEMSSKELKEKARELGVDISGATSKNEVRRMLADVIR